MPASLGANSGTSTLLRDLALVAGRKILEIRADGDYHVDRKDDGSPVTAADLAADKIISAGLRHAFPDVPIISEEQPIPEIDPRQPFFLVDPIDGTKSFISGQDTFTVNIALIKNQTPVAGVLFAPALHRCYSVTGPNAAVVEQWDGTFGSSELRGLDAKARKDCESTALISHAYTDTKTLAWLAERGFEDHKPVGSSLKFGLLAEGGAAIYPRLHSLWEWDIAAGHAILVAAGGTIQNLDRQPLCYGHPSYRTEAFIACAQGQDAQLQAP